MWNFKLFTETLASKAPRVIDPSADLCVICDADTLLISPFPEDFISQMRSSPGLAGCIAHFPPPMVDCRDWAETLRNPAALWKTVSQRLGMPALDMPYRYTLTNSDDPVPFYINLGFFLGPPEALIAFHAQHKRIVPVVRDVLENDFYEQISVPFAAEAAGLCVRDLPICFNFPNDPIADRMYAQELSRVHVIHYLRKKHFDRHSIFCNPQAFDRFMASDFDGSNAVFQSAVGRITGGRFPFPF